MHDIFEGVVKKLLILWFTTFYENANFRYTQHADQVDTQLLNFSPPSFLQRYPRSIDDDLAYHKGHELKAWFFLFLIANSKERIKY